MIVGLMVAAVLYGGYMFLFSGSAGDKKKSYGQSQKLINAFVADLANRIQAADTTVIDTEILEKSSAQWQKDPFLVIKKKTAAEEEAEKEPEIIDRGEMTGAFNYSGFVEMGKIKLAIINGVEYQEGDQLALQDAALKTISSGEVHIYVGAKKGIIVVPIDDTAK